MKSNTLFIIIPLLLGIYVIKGQSITYDTVDEKTAFIQEQKKKAFNAVFLNRNVVNDYSSAVVKNGEILNLSKSKDDDGLSFWHRHDPSISNPPEDYTCVITDPSWENMGWSATNNTCGWTSFQLAETSIYDADTLLIPNIYLFPDMIDYGLFDSINSNDVYNNLDQLGNMSIHFYYDHTSHPEREEPFRNHECVNEIVPGVVYSYNSNLTSGIYINARTSIDYATEDWDRFFEYYRPTEYFVNNNYASPHLLTLKSGEYIFVLETGYYLGEYWWEGMAVILKWFKVRVENYYLNDVGVSDYTNNGISIITYPNPTSNIVNIQTTEQPPLITTINLFDIYGKLLQSVPVTNENTILDLSRYAPGVYFVKAVADGKTVAVRKIVRN